MTQRLKPAAEVMSPDAGLHPDQATRNVGEARFNLPARPSLSQYNGAAPIQANNVEAPRLSCFPSIAAGDGASSRRPHRAHERAWRVSAAIAMLAGAPSAKLGRIDLATSGAEI
jgi:hypothetical protein